MQHGAVDTGRREKLSHPLSRMEHPRLDGGGRHPADPGSLLDCLLAIIDQIDDLPMYLFRAEADPSPQGACAALSASR
jgi:hypothetical protein